MSYLDLVPTEVLEEELGLSRSTLWRLRRQGLPMQKVGGSIRYQVEDVRAWIESRPDTGVRIAEERVGIDAPRSDVSGARTNLLPCNWSAAVALDPKHRPQVPSSPASTARKDWRKYPQEAHLLDLKNSRYRRLTEDEIAVIQGFPPSWASEAGLSHRERIAGLGNAVPPALAEALYRSARHVLRDASDLSTVEICAGFGGLALGAHQAGGFKTLALVEFWSEAVDVLREAGIWDPERIHLSDVKTHKWTDIAEPVDVLSGGPPCQPWSQAGLAKGAEDERDLLGFMPNLVSTLKPRAFFFENVPGLMSPPNREYLESLVTELRAGGGYGVAVGLVQAADYGVPQRRKRVIIAGFRSASDGVAHDFFDHLHQLRTHSDPAKAIPRGRFPWVTLNQALPLWSSTGEWRKWINTNREHSL